MIENTELVFFFRKKTEVLPLQKKLTLLDYASKFLRCFTIGGSQRHSPRLVPV